MWQRELVQWNLGKPGKEKESLFKNKASEKICIRQKKKPHTVTPITILADLTQSFCNGEG